jgi:hypothetical protein
MAQAPVNYNKRDEEMNLVAAPKGAEGLTSSTIVLLRPRVSLAGCDLRTSLLSRSLMLTGLHSRKASSPPSPHRTRRGLLASGL